MDLHYKQKFYIESNASVSCFTSSTIWKVKDDVLPELSCFRGPALEDMIYDLPLKKLDTVHAVDQCWSILNCVHRLWGDIAKTHRQIGSAKKGWIAILMNIVSMPKIFRLPCIERFLDAPLLKKKTVHWISTSQIHVCAWEFKKGRF